MDDDTAEFEAYEEPRKRNRNLGVILLSVAVAVVLIGCGVIGMTLVKGVGGGTEPAAQRQHDGSVPIASASVPPPTSQAPRAVVPAASAPPTSKAPTPTKKPTRKPSPKVTETATRPAPPHSTCAPVRGTNQLPKAQVKGYLDTAATTH